MNTGEKVHTILRQLSCMEAVRDEDGLQEDLALDSLALVTMLMELEDVFGMKLDEADMNPFDLVTVDDVVRLAEKYEGDKDE